MNLYTEIFFAIAAIEFGLGLVVGILTGLILSEHMRGY
jgi:hypothetical protein